MAKTVATIFGALDLFVGILGFFPALWCSTSMADTTLLGSRL